ncbi:hypothetical protein Slin15195_G025680 [Septoria linicola]|uniref:Uncharacterized protein n=1 Tax=Septoria linicola TaxID=215465 RepID=A0A9Q9AH04_9PEZI|nr:hypothetical protein Slin15195_G025680 [Septoria linicola]
MATSYTYIVMRTDYEHYTDEKGSKEVVGTFETLEDANAAAEEDAEEEAGNASSWCPANLESPVNSFGGEDALRARVDYIQADHGNRFETTGNRRGVQQTKYGKLIGIPAGKPDSLKKNGVPAKYPPNVDYVVYGATTGADTFSKVEPYKHEELCEPDFFKMVRTGIPEGKQLKGRQGASVAPVPAEQEQPTAKRQRIA